MSQRDPRRIITPDAFTVAPELLGVGLARPSRRLFAISIDGILIAILSRLGGRLLLTLGAGIMLWRAARSDKRQGRNPIVVTGLRTLSIIMFLAFVVTVYHWGGKRKPSANRVADRDSITLDRDSSNNADANDRGSANIDLGKLGLGFSDVTMVPVFLSVAKAKDSAAAAPIADSIARWIHSRPDSMRTRVAQALVDALEDAPGGAALRPSLSAYLPRDSVAAYDSLSNANGAHALKTAADRRVDSLRHDNAVLRRRVASLQNDEKATQAAYETEKKGWFRKIWNGLSDALGFGFGWSAFYFTTATLLMRGQTPGKKLLGIRVIRLDGEPITGWMSFERFGGYAASAATGLLGFAQILWDPNRQALHDKATETVVIREINGLPERPFDPVTPR